MLKKTYLLLMVQVRQLLLAHNRKSGFSLLEILIALLLFAVGFAAIAQVFARSLFASSDVEKVSLAVAFAQERMEQLRNLGYDNIFDESEPTPVTDFPIFSRQVIVTEQQTQAGCPTCRFKEVEVRLYYPSKPADNIISLFTYVSDI
ncbi:MAG: prepilin-type N-terminal cleavage/methylation domain-containing protein [Candidatus Omnitrophota bacterium]